MLLLALAVTPWVAGAVVSYRNGIGGYDSLDYHLPFAGRFAQSGSVTPIVFVLPGLDQPFYPSTRSSCTRSGWWPSAATSCRRS